MYRLTHTEALAHTCGSVSRCFMKRFFSYEFWVMSDEFWVSIFSVQAMDNVSSLKWLREYSHRLARVLSHGIVSSLIFWWHGWHDGGTIAATVFLLRYNQLNAGDRSVWKKWNQPLFRGNLKELSKKGRHNLGFLYLYAHIHTLNNHENHYRPRFLQRKP